MKNKNPRKRIVLDSLTLKKCLTEEENALLNNIKKICDVICLSDKIKKEYQKPGYFFSALLPGLEDLKSHEPSKIVEPNLGRLPLIKGIRASHSVFIEDALRMNADYFITEREVWAKIQKNIPKNYNIKIVTPSLYIRERRNL